MLPRLEGNILTGLFQFTIALALVVSSPTRLKAQSAELWGTVKDGGTQQSLLADISIAHLESRQTRFFHVRADANGWYAARSLPPGRTILIARAEGFGFAATELVLEPGQILGPVNFELEKAASVWGIVIDEQGSPLKFCRVTEIKSILSIRTSP